MTLKHLRLMVLFVLCLGASLTLFRCGSSDNASSSAVSATANSGKF